MSLCRKEAWAILTNERLIQRYERVPITIESKGEANSCHCLQLESLINALSTIGIGDI